VCLALTPLVFHLTRQLKLDPKPHLIGLAVASNIGSTATLTGNPQNMIIGSLSQIGYLRFAAKLAPIPLLGLVAAYGIMLLLCRHTLSRSPCSGIEKRYPPGKPVRPLHPAHRALLIKSLIVTLGAVGLFFAGAPMAVVAIGAAAILLLE